MRLHFLGTSSDEAIPRALCDCLQCQSQDEKDKRLRPSILIDKKILIDAGPDIDKQLTAGQILSLEAVLITHEHQDHVGGLPSLLKINRNIRIIKLKPGQHFKLMGIDFHAFKVKHSPVIPMVGIEINNLIYIPDFSEIDWAVSYLSESQYAVLDGSVYGNEFGGHMPIIDIIKKIKPMKNLQKIYFTHNGHTHKTHEEMDKLVKDLGDGRYELAYDGLEIKV